MAGSEEEWKAVAAYCEDVILQKETAESIRRQEAAAAEAAAAPVADSEGKKGSEEEDNGGGDPTPPPFPPASIRRSERLRARARGTSSQSCQIRAEAPSSHVRSRSHARYPLHSRLPVACVSDLAALPHPPRRGDEIKGKVQIMREYPTRTSPSQSPSRAQIYERDGEEQGGGNVPASSHNVRFGVG